MSKTFKFPLGYGLRRSLFVASLVLPVLSAPAAVVLPALISNHAVLQKSDKTSLWGKADPGEKVSASLAGMKGEATAGADGKWRIELDLSRTGPGPFDLVVAGNNTITVSDVVVGEVWLASGQSNMGFRLSQGIGSPEEIAASDNPQLRQFQVGNNAAATPQDDCKGSWLVASPTTSGSFSAVAYYFGKELQRTLRLPVGLIHASWGGTPSEGWTSAEALNTVPDLKAACERTLKEVSDYEGLQGAYLAAYHEWEARYARADKVADPAPFADPKAATADWKPVTMPGKVGAAGLPDAGAVWLRKSVSLRSANEKSLLYLDLVHPDGFETVYFNGKKVAGFTPDTFGGAGAPRHYYFSGGIEGENVIAIRLYNPVGGLGISCNPDHFVFGTTSIKGEWLAKAEYELPALSDEARQACPQPPKAIAEAWRRPSVLFNGMIEPVLPYTVQGAIWYQGENNAGRAFQYQTAFPLLINDWRRRWGRDLPFYFCQLAGYGPKRAEPGDNAWAELREAQTKTLALPNTGEAILIDLGESDDIHPRDKKDVGERLSLIALAKTYGKALPCSGPVYDSQKIEGERIRLAFTEIGGGLVARPLPETYVVSSLRGEKAPLVRNSPKGELEGFAICGEDRKWVWADARIEGETVVVSAPSVPNPVAVRYAWAATPTANLYNRAGLPAGPFRTDAFPGVTGNERF